MADDDIMELLTFLSHGEAAQEKPDTLVKTLRRNASAG